jgi:hypothetical protein
MSTVRHSEWEGRQKCYKSGDLPYRIDNAFAIKSFWSGLVRLLLWDLNPVIFRLPFPFFSIRSILKLAKELLTDLFI